MVKITQMNALLIEALRAAGWNNEDLVEKAHNGTLPDKDDSEFQFNFPRLSEFAHEQPELFESAVRQGYQVTYNTIGGINNWLIIVLGKEPVRIADEGHASITVSLTSAEKKRVEAMLSIGWKLLDEQVDQLDGIASYRIVHASTL